MGAPISDRYYFNVKAKVTEENKDKIDYFEDNKGTIFIEEYMMRIMELENIQKETWQIIRKHEGNPTFQLDCYKELRHLTMTLAELYAHLPDALGFSKDLQKQIDIKNNELVRRDNDIKFTDQEKEWFDRGAKF